MNIKLLIRRIHLWVGLLLGAQVMLWMLSGIVMTWFHLDLVRGERTMFSAPAPELAAETFASPGGVIAQTPGATSVELTTRLNRRVYVARGADGASLYDAMTGERISPISREMARDVAQQDFIGEGKIKAVTLMDNPPHEYRGETPVWRADFDDALHTRLYISRDTGRVVSRRNMIWRVYDFFWMLHIMDYSERENFNNPIVKAAAGIGFVFSLSGLVMLFFRSSRRQIVSDTMSVSSMLGVRQKKLR